LVVGSVLRKQRRNNGQARRQQNAHIHCVFHGCLFKSLLKILLFAQAEQVAKALWHSNFRRPVRMTSATGNSSASQRSLTVNFLMIQLKTRNRPRNVRRLSRSRKNFSID
jgi:hypothetical protein